MKKTGCYKEKTRRGFDNKAEHYEQSFDGKYCATMYNSVMEKLKEHRFQTLLDVGCGTGAVMVRVLKEFPGVKVSGIDLSEGMVQKARSVLGDQAELWVGDAESLPWKDESFDMLVCNASFHHYPKPKRVLNEMKRVLKPGGCVIIADPWIPNPFRYLFNCIASSPLYTDGDVKIYSEKELITMLQKCGFQAIQWETRGSRFSISTALG